MAYASSGSQCYSVTVKQPSRLNNLIMKNLSETTELKYLSKSLKQKLLFRIFFLTSNADRPLLKQADQIKTVI